MSIKIKGLVCFVTGANRGIGRAIAEALVQGGASQVYAGARNTQALKDLVAAAKGKVVPVQLDVTNGGQIKTAALSAPDTQILVNNAGIANYTSVMTAPDTSAARGEMEVNYFGLMNMVRAFAPILKKNGGGAIVNISSVGGLVGIPSFGTYCATKAAVHSLTQSVRGELKAQGTFVMGVYPGPIDTDMAAGVQMEKESPASVAREILKGLETGAEEVFPDKVSKEVAARLKTDAKGLEKEWSAWLPQAVTTAALALALCLPLYAAEPAAVIADFDKGEAVSNLGTPVEVWLKDDGSDDTQKTTLAFAADDAAGNPEGRAAVIEYDVDSPNPAYNGIRIDLGGFDARGYKALEFYVKGDAAKGFGKKLKVELISTQTGRPSPYVFDGVTAEWQKVSIPLADFWGIGDGSSIGKFVVVFADIVSDPKAGTIYLDQIAFSK
jgi:NAD(P)-dependent dehydrogenase (short-subunit alcohol dehydrogenase family)